MQCPSENDLRKLIDGGATPEEQAALSEHLDACADCRTALDRLTAGRESWADVRRQLADSPEPAGPALADAMNRLEADAASAETSAEPKRADARKLEFLDPPEKPGHLGRLGHYEILEVVGQGGMGIVLKAYDTKLQRIAAIKVMLPELAARASARQRFIREARAAAAVTHDHVVTIHAVEEDHSPPYLVMQYVAGRSLQERLDACGALELKEILRIGMQAASGLAAAHAQGLVHRDIKPANILLENGIERVKITDFGLARAADDARLTQSGVVTGTPQYMSPEQAGGKSVDHRADLFSLGGVMYAMCTGYAPFRASSSMAVLKKVCDETPRPIRELNPELPDWLAAIVEKLLAKDPKDRFQNASEVAARLGQHLAHLQQPAVFPEPPQVARPAPAEPATPVPRWLTLALLASVVVPFLLNTALFTGWIPTGGTFNPIGAKVGLIACEAIVFLMLLVMHLVADRRSLTIPALLIAAPLIAVPLVLFAGFMHRDVFGTGPKGIDLTPFIMVTVALGAICLVAGLILLAIRLSRRGSRSWIPVAVGLAATVVLLPCLLIGGIAAFTWTSLGRDVAMRSHREDRSGSATTNTLPVTVPVRNAPPNERVLEALRWFPRDSTFFGVIDFTPFGSLTINSPLVQTLLERLVAPGSRAAYDQDNFAGVRLDCVSFAQVENPQKPGESRLYLRLTGQFNRTRMTRFLLQRIKDAVAKPGTGIGQENMTLISSPAESPAFALIGETDVVMAGRLDGDPRQGPVLVQETLELKLYAEGAPAFVKPNLTAGSYERELRNLPEKCFALVLGDLPESVRQSATAGGKGPVRSMPRYVSMIASQGTGAINLDSQLGSPQEATAFAEQLAQQIKGWVDGLKKLPAEAQAAGLIRLLEEAKPKTGGNMVMVDVKVPDDVPGVLAAAARMLPTMYTTGTTAPVPVELLKRFDPKVDKPITKEAVGYRVSEEEGGWRVQHETEAQAQPLITGADSVPLFELPRPAVRGRQVTLRCLVKTEGKDAASESCLELEPGDVRKRSLGPIKKGSTNWAPYEISIDCPANADTPMLRVNARIVWNGSLWIKDLELVAAPLIGPEPPPPAPPVKSEPTRELLVKEFNPLTDKTITTELDGRKVFPVEDGWRVVGPDSGSFTRLTDSTAPRYRLFEVAKVDVRGYQVTVRCKIRSEKVYWARLYLRDRAKHEPELFIAKGSKIEGSTEWTDYEFSSWFFLSENIEGIGIDLSVEGPGTVRIKDVRVTKTPTAHLLELQRLQGTWQATQGEVDGKALTAEQIKRWRANFESRVFTLEKDSGTVQGELTQFDLTTFPRWFYASMTKGATKGESSQIFYDLEEDTIRLCGLLPGKANAVNQFDAKAGSGRWLVTFKRSGQ